MNAPRQGLTRRQKALLHTLASKNGISDADYRDLLEDAAGVRSCTQLDSAGLSRVLERMHALGYEIGEHAGPSAGPSAGYGNRPGMASPAQLALIDSLRQAVFDSPEQGFLHWLRRFFKVSQPRFLTGKRASDAIEGLKAMRDREPESTTDRPEETR